MATLITKSFHEGRDRLKAFLNKYITLDTGLTWRWVSPDSVDRERNPMDKAFDRRGRTGGGGELTSSGMDVYIYAKDKFIRVRGFVPEGEGYAAPHYNLPASVSKKGDSSEQALASGYQFLKLYNFYFLSIRQKGLSITFWLDKYSKYNIHEYSIHAKYKGSRLDRMTLSCTSNNLRKFDYIENLIPKLKKAIHESIH